MANKLPWSFRTRGKAPWGQHEDDDTPRGLSRLAEEKASNSPFAKKLADNAGVGAPTETQRVCQLPLRDYSAADLTHKYAKKGCTWRLRPIQSQALAALEDAKGGLFSIGVGWGKTLIGFLAAHATKSKFTIFLAPASTCAQLESNYMKLKGQFKLGPVEIVSYGRLSRPDGSDLLERLAEPYKDEEIIIVCDEVHRIKRKESARTKRVIRFLREHQAVRFVGMSGTLTSKGLKDMAHIAEMALRENSPLPRDRNHINAWAECIDVDGQPGDTDWKTVVPLWKLYNDESVFRSRYKDRRTRIRKAFQQRFRTSPGVVASVEGALGCSLELLKMPLLTPPSIENALELAVDEEATPDGDVFKDDSSQWRALRQISAGFYYRWVWPDGEADEDWLDARYEWSRCVRRELSYSAKQGYDSPLLVANQVARELEEGRRGFIHRAWALWFGSGLSKQKAPPTEAVWIDDFLIRDAVAWAGRQEEPVILWYESKAVEDKLRENGIPVYGAGNNPPETGPTCAMSIRAHGVGKNLQHGWSSQLALELPSSGTVWEQLLGRTHRPGQEADTVKFYMYQHTQPYKQAMAKARTDAAYIQDTTGGRQKLLYCTYGIGLVNR